jgi:hypothetical protein
LVKAGGGFFTSLAAGPFCDSWRRAAFRRFLRSLWLVVKSPRAAFRIFLSQCPAVSGRAPGGGVFYKEFCARGDGPAMTLILALAETTLCS